MSKGIFLVGGYAQVEGHTTSLRDTMNTLEIIAGKYNLDLTQRSPIEIPNVGRNGLAVLFNELDFKVGVEVGTEQGLYAEVLCKSNPDALLYCIDPWKHYTGYRDHVNQEKLDNFYEITKERVAKYNCRLMREFSLDAVTTFGSGSIDFVYIDGNHELPFVMNDLIEWSKCVKIGGIVAGHDYRENKSLDTHNHVIHAVNAYTGAYRISPWFLLGTKAIVPGQARDRPRSWMWVKR